MMLDWKRDACEVLLTLYQDQPILYDQRHPKYYNKNQRKIALNKMIEGLKEVRPGTTASDIIRKVQTMRTQLGTECGKMRRAEAKGQDYEPTVWWYPYISFLVNHIKPRDTVEVKEEYEAPNKSEVAESEGEYENYEETYEVENDDQELVFEIQATPLEEGTSTDSTSFLLKKVDPPRKTIKRESTAGPSTPVQKRVQPATPAATTPTPSKIKRLEETIEEPQSILPEEPIEHHIADSSSATKFTPTAVVAAAAPAAEVLEVTVDSDRCRSLGNFVASQIASIKDEYLFYSTQMDVLNVISKAQLKQLQLDKEEKAKK